MYEMICDTNEITAIDSPLEVFNSYMSGASTSPIFLIGDALSTLKLLPDESIDSCMTSPPYWNKRQYNNGGIGLETNYAEYIFNLITVFEQIKRILKPTGSFWLNIGDSYQNKSLLGIPWRVAIRMTDEQGWTLRN